MLKLLCVKLHWDNLLLKARPQQQGIWFPKCFVVCKCLIWMPEVDRLLNVQRSLPKGPLRHFRPDLFASLPTGLFWVFRPDFCEEQPHDVEQSQDVRNVKAQLQVNSATSIFLLQDKSDYQSRSKFLAKNYVRTSTWPTWHTPTPLPPDQRNPAGPTSSRQTNMFPPDHRNPAGPTSSRQTNMFPLDQRVPARLSYFLNPSGVWSILKNRPEVKKSFEVEFCKPPVFITPSIVVT